jgi:DNA-binding XRE family transcriptional regulator
MKKQFQVIVPKSISQHIEEEYKKSTEFRKSYDEEIARLEIAHHIERLRVKRGLTQAQLARRINTTQQTISRLEDTTNVQISVKTLMKVASALRSRLCIHFIPVR